MLTGKARWKEVMTSPPTRFEMEKMEHRLMGNVASLAAAIECMEERLVERGIFTKDELMGKITELLKEKQVILDGMEAKNGS